MHKELIRPHASGGYLSWRRLHSFSKNISDLRSHKSLSNLGLDKAHEYFFGTKNMTELAIIIITWRWGETETSGLSHWRFILKSSLHDRWPWLCLLDLPLGETVTKRCDRCPPHPTSQTGLWECRRSGRYLKNVVGASKERTTFRQDYE